MTKVTHSFKRKSQQPPSDEDCLDQDLANTKSDSSDTDSVEETVTPKVTKKVKPKNKKSTTSVKTRTSFRIQSMPKERNISTTSKKSIPTIILDDTESGHHTGEWDRVSKRKIWCERNIHEGDFKECISIVNLIHDQGLRRTIYGLKPFVQKVVYEFYCNMDPNVKNMEHKDFEHVYVRGHLFEFSPSVINKYLCSSQENCEGYSLDYDIIISHVTGGVLRAWPRGKDFPASQLTAKFAILHKIAMRNWLPTSHGTGVNKSMADLLFKIGNSISFDVGKFFFDQIVKHAERKNERSALPFPSLIYGILSSQQTLIQSKEVLFVDKEEIRISHKLLAGDHVNDLGDVPADVTPSKVSDSPLLSRSIKVLQDELKFLDDQLLSIEKRRKELIKVINNYKRNKSDQTSLD